MDAKKLAQLIMTGHDDILMAGIESGITIDPAQIGSQFCAVWPKAKPVLNALGWFAVLIPGAGATAAGVLQGLIRVGDMVSNEVCKT